MRLSFGLFITLGAVFGHAYLYRRLVHETTRSRLVRTLALVLLAVIALVLSNRRRIQDLFPPELALDVFRASYLWMGAALFVVQALLVIDIGRALFELWRRVGRRSSPAPTERSEPSELPAHPERREFLARAVAGSALGLGGTVALYGGWRAWTAPEVTELALRIPKLPRTLDGLSIVQLTDVHVGPFIRRPFLDDLVARVNALKPDLVVVTGDLVDGSVAQLGNSVAALGHLQSRFGHYFVTGNHDYYSGDVEWTAFLEQLGFGVLRNRHVPIGDGGGTFDLVGVDDWSGWRRRGRPGYDLDRALAGRDPDRASVLLAHQPANFRVAAERGVDLQISGHTHGGQIFPMTHVIGLHWEHVAGHYRHEDGQLYVSRGCGFWGPPMRVGSPPEIAKLVLTT